MVLLFMYFKNCLHLTLCSRYAAWDLFSFLSILLRITVFLKRKAELICVSTPHMLLDSSHGTLPLS